MKRYRADEGGFTLVELLVVISILGIISFGLTEAVIIGFRTTDAITTDVTRFSGVDALRSYFTEDVRQADRVSTDLPPCTTSLDPQSVLLLHLAWTEPGGARDISYSLEPPVVPGERQLVRRSCVGAVAEKRMLGLLEFDPAGPLPVTARCDRGPCPATAADPEPGTVTLKILTNRPRDPLVAVDLTVRRRTS